MTPRYSRTNDQVRLSVTRQEFRRITAAAAGFELLQDAAARMGEVLREILGETVYAQLVAAQPARVELVVVDR